MLTKDDRKWYAVYTKPRWEKKVSGLLSQQGMETYCPLNRTQRRWSDRAKWVEEPLFRSYVFVRVPEEGLSGVRLVSGVVNFVYWMGKPAIIRDKEIEAIKRFLNDHVDVEVFRMDPQTNDRITIQHGIFMNREARVIKVLNNRVQVVIESLGCRLVALIRKTSVSIIEKQKQRKK